MVRRHVRDLAGNLQSACVQPGQTLVFLIGRDFGPVNRWQNWPYYEILQLIFSYMFEIIHYHGD